MKFSIIRRNRRSAFSAIPSAIFPTNYRCRTLKHSLERLYRKSIFKRDTVFDVEAIDDSINKIRIAQGTPSKFSVSTRLAGPWLPFFFCTLPERKKLRVLRRVARTWFLIVNRGRENQPTKIDPLVRLLWGVAYKERGRAKRRQTQKKGMERKKGEGRCSAGTPI